MSEPYGDKWKRYKVFPNLMNSTGAITEHIKLNIGDPSSLEGPTGATGSTGATGATGPAGNPSMILQSPNGSVFQIIVQNDGTLDTLPR